MNWFDELFRYLASGLVAGTGTALARDAGSLVARQRQLFYDTRYADLDDLTPVRHLAGHNAFVWKSIFLANGGFEDLGGSSDVRFAELLHDRGLPVQFAPRLVVDVTLDRGLAPVLNATFRSGYFAKSSLVEFSRLEFEKARATCRVGVSDPVALVANLGFQAVRCLGYIVGRIQTSAERAAYA
jgi:hypothetical protein